MFYNEILGELLFAFNLSCVYQILILYWNYSKLFLNLVSSILILSLLYLNDLRSLHCSSTWAGSWISSTISLVVCSLPLPLTLIFIVGNKGTLLSWTSWDVPWIYSNSTSFPLLLEMKYFSKNIAILATKTLLLTLL